MNERETRLDVRPVEPKDRFETIMSAYDRLEAEERMHLTVDHDPKCMYYTLEATRGGESFSFDYLEEGPEVWQVVVTKRSRAEASAPEGV